MAGRGRTTSQKRQKEQARLERRQQKAAKKEARKASKDGSETDDNIDWHHSMDFGDSWTGPDQGGESPR